MTWPQFSDLKGNDSENVTNWQITTIPVYYLLDANWHVVDRDIMPSEIVVTANQYFDHH